MAWNPPPHYYRGHPASIPFWDFLASLDPNAARGLGVDRAPEHGAGFPNIHLGPGFPFGPGGFDGWARRNDWGPWGGRHRGGEEGAGPWRRRPSCRGQYCRDGTLDDEEPSSDAARAAAPGGEDFDGKEDSPSTVRDATEDPPEVAPEEAPEDRPRPHHRHGPGRRGRGGFHRHHHSPHHHGPPPPPPYGGPHGGPHGGPRAGPYSAPPPPPPPNLAFDFRPMLQAFASHPFAQQLRGYLERAAQNGEQSSAVNAAADGNDNENASDDVERFSPPVDVFHLENKWVLHIAVPGAKKEDVGVNWDADRSVLGVSGVVYRPGDEGFLQGLVSGERRVGLFSRDVKLPPEPADVKEEVDAFNISAKMEDGVLIVTVPKVEKEWTEVKKVEVE